jgi:glycosyltransferase involved in cell wall biosynthesis
MIRILHIHEHEADLETQRGVEALQQGLGAEFSSEMRTIGRGGTWRDVAGGAAALRRERGEFDLIHAWGGAALTIAALGARAPIVLGTTSGMRAGTVRWLRAVMDYRAVEVICPTSTMQRALLTRGVSPQRCHLIRPGVDFARVKSRRDVELRTRLGFADNERVILGIGESTRAAAHAHAAWAVGILHVADPRQRLLLWGRGPLVQQVRRLALAWKLKNLMSIWPEAEFEQLTTVADVALVSARGAVSTLPISITMASSLPIVATVTRTVSELLEDRHTALMAPPHNPRLLARRILDLEEEPPLRWSIADLARTEAYDYFALTRFRSQFRAVYTQVAAGERVQVPQPAAGAGLRFHGRA